MITQPLEMKQTWNWLFLRERCCIRKHLCNKRLLLSGHVMWTHHKYTKTHTNNCTRAERTEDSDFQTLHKLVNYYKSTIIYYHEPWANPVSLHICTASDNNGKTSSGCCPERFLFKNNWANHCEKYREVRSIAGYLSTILQATFELRYISYSGRLV